MKKLLLTSIVSSILLAGCGGSDSDNSSNSGLSGKWTAYYNDGARAYDHINISQGNLSVYEWGTSAINFFNIGDIYYYNVWHEAEPNFIMSKQGLSSDIYNYNTEEFSLGKISKLSKDTWKITPKVSEGKSGFNFTFKATLKDINDLAYSTVFPNSNNSATFPKGSACLVPISLKANQDFILGDAQSLDDDESFFDEFDYKYNNLSNSTLISANFIYGTKFKVSNNYEGFNYGYLSGAVKNENFAGVGLHSDINQNLIYNWYLIDNGIITDQEVKDNDQCIYFNEKATEFINNQPI